MSIVNDDDLESVCPQFEGVPDRFTDYTTWETYAHRFADRYVMELEQIILGKLNADDAKEFKKLVDERDILIYILFKKDTLDRGGCFPWFNPIYEFLSDRIPDIHHIGRTLKKDICNDFKI